MAQKNNFKLVFNKVKGFILNDLWTISSETLPRSRKVLILAVRTIVLAFRGFKEDKVNLRASSLTYYSLLSVVPVLALAFGFAKGFGFDKKLESIVFETMKGQEDVASWMVNFATNMLKNVNEGWIIGIGLIFLVWTVMQVLGNIERAFNGIWQVKKSRVLFRKFSDYMAIMLFAPLMLTISSSAQVVMMQMVNTITNEITLLGYVGPIIVWMIQLVPFILIWLLFTFIYMIMPNTKVKFGSALVAGILAGTAFQLLQWGYFHFQVGVSRYNAIYGSFAALPLFLVWLNWSWLIVLFGAEISFAVQNQHQYEFESDIRSMSFSSKQNIAIYITHFIVKNFKCEELPLTAQQISKSLKLPVRLVRHLLYELIECRIIAETPSLFPKEPAFIPARDIHTLSIFNIINGMQNRGSIHEANLNEKDLRHIEDKMKSFSLLIQNATDNQLLMDI